MNKRIALLLFLALLLHAHAFAAVRSGDWAYDVLEDGTASIAGYLGLNGTVSIPEQIDGHTVSQIGEGVFSFGNTLEDVTVPGCVKRIGASAFENMKKLRRVTLEEGVETIGALAFNLCAKLEEITLPASVTQLGSEDGALPVFDAGIRLVVTPGSAAEAYARQNGLTVEYVN